MTQNKKNLLIFLKALVSELAVKEILVQGESLTCGGKTTHQEADTMIVQAMHGCLNKYRRFYVFAEDTDMFLLLIHFMYKWQIAGLKVYMLCGQRYLPLHEFISILGDRCGKLLGMHVLTGCDTVNSVYSVSKPKLGHEILAVVGSSFNTLPPKNEIVAYLYDLYGMERFQGTMNQLRYKLSAG